MSQRRAGIFNRCPGCRINNNLCVCGFIKPQKILTNISLVVHVNEVKLTSNTAWFVQKLLPENAQIFLRGSVNETFDASEVVKRVGHPLFLYPHADAVELNEEFVKNLPGPCHLIVPDGNWHQARRVRKREALFKGIEAVKLPKGPVSEYKLREAGQPEWLSTFEATVFALALLESPQIKDRMMDFFRLWVKTTVYNRTKNIKDKPVDSDYF